MKINEQCLPCLINQAIKIANITNADNREELYKKIFAAMSNMDFSKTNPEIVGENYRLIKQHIGCDDPYRETKNYYNRFFLDKMDAYDKKIHSIEEAVKYAIVANIIDFNPVHANVKADMEHFFAEIDNLELTVNDVDYLVKDIRKANSILYLGDSCGEICFDKLLIKRIRQLNPKVQICFGVRGEAVVNENKNMYFLLMAKCKVIADYIGVKQHVLICLRNKNR